MSDDLDIRHGGVVAVDTASLRAAAEVIAMLQAECAALRGEAESITLGLLGHAATAWAAADLGHMLVRELSIVADDALAIATALHRVADVYEIVELRAQAQSDALVGGRVALGSALALALARGRTPEAAHEADRFERAWGWTHGIELQRQLWLGAVQLGALGAALRFVGLAAPPAVSSLGGGRIHTRSRLRGAPGASLFLSTTTAPPAPPPPDLTALAERLPPGDEQVRVERYTDADGVDRFVVYVAGTQDFAFGGEEPWDMTSNLQAYAGQSSASYEGVVAALREAGVGPDDPVIAVGHSQGAALTSRLALEGEFTIAANVTFGSPVHADLPADVMNITVRHRDDPVAALADGGFAATHGGTGSFIAERTADPGVGSGDLAFAAHVMTGYRETAAMVDTSGDPRVAPLRELLSGLGAPAAVTTYQVRRTQ